MDVKLKDLADLAVATKVRCPWCIDLGYWVLHGRGIPRDKIKAVPRCGAAIFSNRSSGRSSSTPRDATRCR
jgi:AhpD family alkylhydroperoxidase